MTSRSTWLLIWVLLGLAPAAVLAQVAGTLVAVPTRAQATVDVQGTVQGLIAKLTRAGRLQVRRPAAAVPCSPARQCSLRVEQSMRKEE